MDVSQSRSARIIAATNLDLRAVRGGFREDLLSSKRRRSCAPVERAARRHPSPGQSCPGRSKDIDFPATKVSATAIRRCAMTGRATYAVENRVKSAALLTSATIIEAHDLRLAGPSAYQRPLPPRRR